MTTYVGNAFSLQMLQGAARLNIQPVTAKQVGESLWYAKEMFVSVFGHADVAKLAEGQLAPERAEDWAPRLPVNRVSVILCEGDVLYVAQYVGSRLPEGATSLPEGAEIRWLCVTVYPPRDRVAEQAAGEAADKAAQAAQQAAYDRGWTAGKATGSPGYKSDYRDRDERESALSQGWS